MMILLFMTNVVVRINYFTKFFFIFFFFSIWDYLIEITTQSRKTVIITTHYIEEARQAQSVSSELFLVVLVIS